MKCPSCNKKLAWNNLVESPNEASYYECPSCHAKSAPVHGLLFFVIFFLLAAPIIEFLVRLSTEALFHSFLSGTTFLGWELSRVISVAITAVVMIAVYFRLNRLAEINDEKSVEPVSVNQKD
jgi:uncharacterized membrane protein